VLLSLFTLISHSPFSLSLYSTGDNCPESLASRNAQLNIIVAARAAKVPRFLLVRTQSLNHSVLHSSVLYCTGLYFIALHCAMLYYAVLPVGVPMFVPRVRKDMKTLYCTALYCTVVLVPLPGVKCRGRTTLTLSRWRPT